MNLFQLGIKNLRHKPWSTALSLCLAALGAGLISLLLLLNNQFQQKFDRNLAGIDLVIGAKGSPLQLILSSMYHVDAPTGNISIDESKAFIRQGHPLIEASVPLSLGDNYRSYRIVGTTPTILSFYEAEIAEGKVWGKPMEVTAGALAAQKLGLKLGDTFNSGHGMDVHDNFAFKVVGILKASGSVLDQLLLTPNSSLWLVHEHDVPRIEEETEEGDSTTITEEHAHGESDTHDHEHEHDHDHDHDDDHAIPSFDEPLHTYTDKDITSILLKFKGKNFQALNMGRNINENTNLQAATPAIEINRLYNNIGAGEKILRALLAVIVFVSILSIFISLYANLDERRYGLALMRVMGANRSKVMGLIILEGILLAVVGCLLGIFLSHVGMLVFSNYIEEGYRYTFEPWTFLKEEGYLLGAAFLIGAFAALIPALRARNTEIAGTLTEK